MAARMAESSVAGLVHYMAGWTVANWVPASVGMMAPCSAALSVHWMGEQMVA